MDVDIYIEIKVDEICCMKKYTYQDIIQIKDFNLLINKITEAIRLGESLHLIDEMCE